MIEKLIAYYRSCYQADYRAISLMNFLGNKTKVPLFLESAELLKGEIEDFPVPAKWGKSVDKLMAVYAKEYDLYCGAFFLLGSTSIGGRKLDVLAPLYLFPISLSLKDELYSIRIDLNNPIINPAIVQLIGSEQIGLWEGLNEELPKKAIGFDEQCKIEEVLAKYFPALDSSAIENFPSLLSGKELKTKQAENKGKAHFELFPACGLCSIRKPRGSMGVLNELEQIVQENSFSTALNALFKQKQKKGEMKSRQFNAVPVILSEAQQNSMQAAQQFNLSLIVGPPGTGKSFTIAALAIEFMHQGKSVLIASKNNQAGKVIADKIEYDFELEGLVVRAGKKDYKAILQKQIQNWLSGIGVNRIDEIEYRALKRLLKQKLKNIKKIESKLIKQIKNEKKRGQLLEQKNGILKKWKLYFLENRIKKETPIWELIFKLENETQEKIFLQKKIININADKKIAHILNKNRTQIKNLLKALKARTGNKKERIFGDLKFKYIFKALPIWISNSTDINKVLPLEKELFDIVIIDEATQCDIASSIPLLQRGKKSVIVGDPKQLRHMSFLSKKKQEILIREHKIESIPLDEIDYRSKSILDIVLNEISQQNQVSFLNEHFRSMPDLIAFSNQHFYNNKLHIMHARPKNIEKQHLFVHAVPGKRYKSGYNKIEAEAIFKLLDIFIEKHAVKQNPMSIGILSPFTDQADYISRQLFKNYSLETIDKYKILVGTPYTFQGEEKDQMLLSFALDNDAHPSAFHYLNKEDVFNVSITRARSQQDVFISFDPDILKGNSLLGQYLNQINNSNSIPINEAKSLNDSDDFFNEIKNFLNTKSPAELLESYAIAGIEIDLVFIKNGKTYCIELLGFPGDFQSAPSLERWRMLERVGLRTFYLPYSHWFFNSEKCKRALNQFLN